MNMEKLPLCILIFMSLSNALSQTDMSEKSFVLPQESDDSYVILKPHLDKPLKAFTVCLKVFTDLKRSCCLFSYATESHFNDILIFKRPVGSYLFAVGDEEVVFQVPEIIFAPQHICVGWESESGIAEFWLDGKPMVRKALNKGYSVGIKSKIILGQDQDSFGGGFDKTQSLVGDIGDVYMWDSMLSPEDIISIYLGGTFSPNVLDWRKLDYEKKGSVVTKPQLWV
ncbi:C-reactive protein-like [Macrotis lagotis]|uniref:C-reactive protein-like n=1 Tax=Macrotis lagotis TaxID=92651 RepID=UPI003D695045